MADRTQLNPYNPAEPFIRMKLEGSLFDRLIDAGIPFMRALKYFHEKPEGNAAEFLKLLAEDIVPFYGNYRNGGDWKDYAKEAVLFGLPVPGNKTTKTVNTPNGVIDLKLNSKVPLLDESMNAEFERLNKAREDVNWREKVNYDSNPWFGDEYKELGDEMSPEGYMYNYWGDERYQSNSIKPDDFNNYIDEYYADAPEYFEERYGNPEDIKFKPGSQEFAEAEANAMALDKLYSEMNNDNALISNVERINHDRELALSDAYWKAQEDIYKKYKNPEYNGSPGFIQGKDVVPEDWSMRGNNKKPLTPEERIELANIIQNLEQKLETAPWVGELFEDKLKQARIDLERGYREVPLPEPVKAFPDYESYRKFNEEIADLKSRSSEFEYTPNEADIKPADVVYDYVLNDPNLLQYEVQERGRSPIYARLLDNEYKYEPNSILNIPSSAYIEASLKNYKEPFRMTVGDFDEISKALDAKRLSEFNYNDIWTDNLKKEIDLLDNDMISAEDKLLMKQEIDRIAPEIFSTTDESRRKSLLRMLQNNLEALGLNWAK